MSIRLLLDMAAEALPDRTALGSRQTGRSTTFKDLAAEADRGAAALRRTGAKSVAFVGTNSDSVPTLLFAAATAGMAFAPLNYRLSVDATIGLIDRLDSPVLVGDAAFIDALRPSVQVAMSTTEWREALDTATPDTTVEAIDDDTPAVLLFTSGTTAAPKCAVLRHSHLMSYVFGTVEFGVADENECAAVCVPPYHIAGVGSILTNTYSGRRVVYLPNFSPGAWLQLVRDESVTNAMVVPTMLARVVDELGGQPAHCPDLKLLAYGGSRIATPVLANALDAFPDTDFVNAYGLTETSSTISVLGPDDHRRALKDGDLQLLSSAGRIVPGIEAQIRNEDADVLAPGQIGELWVRGPQVSGEYEDIGSVLDDAGWFPTRDLACIDDDGYIYLSGRSDDTIIRGGENIAPFEIEDVLLSHNAVREAAVVGIPDADWGQRLAAVIVLRESLSDHPSADDLRTHVRDRLRGSRTPDDVYFRTELPLTPTGKVLRRILVEDIQAAARPQNHADDSETK
jgi:acyl-CoA synthetase (AMP-forming)/AMP-acid ligase II